MHSTKPIYYIALGHQLQGERQHYKATSEGGRKRKHDTYTRLLSKLHQSIRKSQEFLQGNVSLSTSPFFYVPRSDLKSSSVICSEPESERSFSELKLGEAVGRVQQNNGALISSSFCRREKNSDAFPLCSFYFFH